MKAECRSRGKAVATKHYFPRGNEKACSLFIAMPHYRSLDVELSPFMPELLLQGVQMNMYILHVLISPFTKLIKALQKALHANDPPANPSPKIVNDFGGKILWIIARRHNKVKPFKLLKMTKEGCFNLHQQMQNHWACSPSSFFVDIKSVCSTAK